MNTSEIGTLAQLKLPEIARWQIDQDSWRQLPLDYPTPPLLASLPALQRGAVWKPKQVENLWDSLIRGFPIGSFLVSPSGNGSRGIQRMAYSTSDSPEQHGYYLLDGQQRANAIALGFLTPLYRDHSALLWIDLEPTNGKSDDREFVFRVINKFHPWGFSRANPEEKLRVSEIRDAFLAFKSASMHVACTTGLQQASPSNFPLGLAWPWDAVAPIPVAFLWGAKSCQDVWSKLKELPYWDGPNPPKWKSEIEKITCGKNPDGVKRLENLLGRLNDEMTEYEIPVLTVPLNSRDVEVGSEVSEKEVSEKPDHIETLFVRINSGGTPLEGEELIYSILKADWKDAPVFIDKLAHQLTSPARTVVLAARLIQARLQTNDEKVTRQPAVLNVSAFRRLFRGNQIFRGELKNALSADGDHNVIRTFAAAHTFLCMDTPQDFSGNIDYRLHPYLAADLFRGPSGHEVGILLLRWMDRLLMSGIAIEDIPKATRRRSLGFITALSWFSTDVRECVSRLWGALQTCDAELLKEFFSAQRFRDLISRAKDKNIVLIPPVSATVFSKCLSALCKDIEDGALDDRNSGYWKDSNYFRNHRKNELAQWVEEAIYPLWDEHQREDVESWWLDKIWADRKFVIYAQRDWLLRWFPDYDPTVPGASDTNRPWDYDHIHPNNFVAGRWYLPSFLKQLHWSNGNFRAWPLEANRADQDAAPRRKLKEKTSRHEDRYGLSVDSLPRASYIRDAFELELWCESVPDDADRSNTNYLSDPQNYRASQVALVKAITTRLGRVYAEWYESMRLADLLPLELEESVTTKRPLHS